MELPAATAEAFRLIASGDSELLGIVGLSLYVAFASLAITSPVAIAFGYAVATYRFPGRRLLVVLVQTLLAFPTVAIGLILYFLLTRRGPLGALHLLFTPGAIIAGDIVIAFPVLAAFSLAAVQAVDVRVSEAAVVLGARPVRVAWTVLFEGRFAIVAAILNGFGRVIAEVGCALMVGGNIAGATRTVTTAIALETSKGEFSQGIALGIVLLAMALVVNLAMSAMQGRGGLRHNLGVL